MTPREKAAANGRALEQMRHHFRTRLDGPDPALALEAARSDGFGSDPIDERIRVFVHASHGAGWEHPRPPHPWERGSSDEELTRLYTDEDSKQAELKRTEKAMWAGRDAKSPDLPRLIKQWEKAYEVASEARRLVTARALYLQDKYRFELE